MEKINIAEILKDCPSGMELDCTMYEDVYFDYVDELNIIHCYIQCENYKTSITFNQHGTPNSNIKSKCVIFPKGKTTWDGFAPPCQFKDGDVIVDKYGAVAIYKRVHSSYEEPYVDFHCGITSEYRSFFVKDSDSLQHCGKIDSIRLATEEEKAKLFQAIKDKGYKWNPETKTLEKLVEPKFKVGDRVRNKNYKDYIYTIHDIVDKGYSAKEIDADYPIIILFGSQEDNYELVPNKFDITTLKSFESKVLVRNWNSDYWKPAIFGFTEKNKNAPFYVEGGNFFNKCIPYEGNEHLLGTTSDCDEYYKTW